MTQDKKVDEGWKESVAQEKEKTLESAQAEGQTQNADQAQGAGADSAEQTFDFRAYITSLAMQALIFMGVIPNPLTDEKMEKNLDQARLLIDTLAILKDKTKGNLTKDEDDLLNTILYELQMKFVEESQGGSKG